MPAKQPRRGERRAEPHREPPAKNPVRLVHALLVALLAGLLYANTVGNGYVLDDRPLIEQNPAVQRGLAGIPELLRSDLWQSSNFRLGYYRPLSLVTFAVEQQFLGGNPHVSHLVNALLFALACGLLVFLLGRVFPSRGATFALLVGLLFASHPIHTEVVGSIKGRDELLAFLGVIASLGFLLAWRDGRGRAHLVASMLCFYLALLSKETALIGVALAPLALHVSGGGSLLAAAKKTWPLAAVLLVFLLQKELVLPAADVALPDDLTNYPYRDLATRLPTALTLFLFGLRLLAVPHPLRYDYSFDQIPAVHWDSAWPYVGAVVFAAGIWGAVAAYRRRSASGLGLAFLYVTFLPALAFTVLRGGIFVERLLFFPSLGFCIVLVAALSAWRSWMPAAAILALCAVFGFGTVVRNQVWKDNFTLFSHDIRTGAASAQNQRHLGEELVNLALAEPDAARKAQLAKDAEAALEAAIRINPKFGEAHQALGVIHRFLVPDLERAIADFRKAVDATPGLARSWFELGRIHESKGELNKASYLYNQALACNPVYAEARAAADALKAASGLDIHVDPFASEAAVPGVPKSADDHFKLGDYHASRGDFVKAAASYETALAMDPGNVGAGINLANCYGMLKRYADALEVGKRLEARFPRDPSVLENLAVTLGLMGEPAKADEYLERARRLRQGR